MLHALGLGLQICPFGLGYRWRNQIGVKPIHDMHLSVENFRNVLLGLADLSVWHHTYFPLRFMWLGK